MTIKLSLSLTLDKSENALDGITCNEPAVLSVLEKLLTSNLLIKNFKNPITRDMIGCEAKQLTKYKSLVNKDTNNAKVKYNRVKGMSFGRSNPDGAVGLFCMRKTVRHTFAKRVGLVDIDIANAHPQFLYQICVHNGLSCDKLKVYIENRNEILQKVMNITKCDRDRAKELFIRLLYFGKFENWLKEKKDKDGTIIYPEINLYAFQNDTDFLRYIDELTEQLQKIGEHIVKANPKIEKEVEKNKKLKEKEDYNKIGSIVSFYLQEIEVRILEQIFLYCKEKRYIVDNVCVLCADGIMLESERIKDVNVYEEFSNLIKSKFGFELKFEGKELDDCLSDEEIEKHQITDKMLDDAKFVKFDSDYFNSLDSYLLKKLYFEKFVCKVIRPDPVYIFVEQSENSKEDVMCFYTQGKITEAFNHFKTGEFYDNGEEVKFMTKWLNDSNILCYNEMDFIPFNADREVISKNVFNLFRGFHKNCKSPYDFDKRKKLLQPFFDLGLQLCGGEQKHFDYLLKYIADMFQNPNKKNPIAFIIKGKQGTGKNVWLNAIGNCLGKQHYITSSNPNDFFGDYAEGFYHKLLVNMNECEGKDTFEFEGRIKSFITEDTVTLNRKFVQPITIKNLARLIIFTNKQNPIPIDVKSKDRRYVVYETTDYYLNDKYGTSFWVMCINHFKRPDFMSALYDYFNELDISNFDFKSERPITTAYIQMCKLYVPVEVLFIENKIVKAYELNVLFQNSEKTTSFENEGVNGVDLYEEYTDYCKKFGFYKDASFQKNIKVFYARLKELELPMLSKNPNGSKTFHFNCEEVLNFMKQKKWIDRNDDDVEVVKDIRGEDFTNYFDV